MKKIFVLTDVLEEFSPLVKSLQLLFPDCKIQIVANKEGMGPLTEKIIADEKISF